MTLESTDCNSVCIRAVRQDKPRNKWDYRADLIRRFGRVPTPSEIATMESKAAGHGAPVGDNNTSHQKAAIRAARRRQGEITENAILDALGSREMTSADLSNITGIQTNTVANAGLRLEAMGKVTRTFRRHVTVWRKVGALQEAAE